ncbi:hypothetical protein ACOME3_009301 [Neoechinorhynchus agilis]
MVTGLLREERTPKKAVKMVNNFRRFTNLKAWNIFTGDSQSESSSDSDSSYFLEKDTAECIQQAEKFFKKNDINQIAFDVKKLAKHGGNETFPMLAFKIFEATNLIDDFEIDENKLYSCLKELQATYKNNNYHSFLHGADVLHQCYLLTVHLSDSSEQLDDESTDEEQSVKSRFTNLELLSLFISALMHDAGHPGCMNNFLIKKRDPLVNNR